MGPSKAHLCSNEPREARSEVGTYNAFTCKEGQYLGAQPDILRWMKIELCLHKQAFGENPCVIAMVMG